MTKHLYIHIPFCNQICSFCDFKRIKTNSYEIMKNFVKDIIKQLHFSSTKNQYSTIYLGGGTPNHLPNDLLDELLHELSFYLSKDYEFTIECNPDLLTIEQAQIFKKNKLNRVSLGAQILNDKLLKQLRRNHSVDDIQNAINNLRKVGIDNISLDFIYDLPGETFSDLDKIFNFISDNQIKHISFYALEIKDNAILNKMGYKIDYSKEEEQMKYIQQKFKELNYKRYEISNWAINEKYQSQHNKAYWLSHDWKALGFGASGFENQHLYNIKNKISQPIAEVEKLSEQDYYFQVLMMGLRLKEGIDITQLPYKLAYEHFKDKLVNCHIKNNHLICNDIDLLNDTLLELMD